MINLSKKEKHSEDKPKKKINLALKIAIIIVIIILVLVATIFVAGYIFLHSKLDKLNYVDLSKEQIYIDEKVEEDLEEYRNIALLGIDARADTFDLGYRSDCIMIISINQKTNKVKIASVYRDIYMDVEGYGRDKITHAYAYGGPQLSLSTLNKNLDLNISEFVAVNFDTVRVAVNSIGGVTINVDDQEVKYINSYINALNKQFGTNSANITVPGTYNLDGVQALAYSRIRYTAGGDYKRTERMREVLTKAFDKAKSINVMELNKLTDIIFPHISTNINKNEIINLLPKIINYDVTETFGWPYKVAGFEGKAWYGIPITLEKNVSELHKQLFNEENYIPSDTVKQISQDIINDTGYDMSILDE